MNRPEAVKFSGVLRKSESPLSGEGFWTLFVAIAALVLVQVVNPATVEKIVGMLAGMIP